MTDHTPEHGRPRDRRHYAEPRDKTRRDRDDARDGGKRRKRLRQDDDHFDWRRWSDDDDRDD
jgi:hypothetical protein